MTTDTVTVTPVDNRRITYNQIPYVAGDQVAVPLDLAAKWIRAGWVEQVREERQEPARRRKEARAKP